MALQKTINLKSVMNIDTNVNAYIKVTEVRATKTNAVAYVDFSQSSDNGSFNREHYEFRPSVSEGSDNFIKQAYVYLKTLDEFSDATDC